MKKADYATVVRRAVEHIASDPARRHTVRSIASAADSNARSLLRAFRAVTGKTVVGYLAHLRVQKAKALLKNTDLLVSEIATQVGYVEPTYFTATFRRLSGLSPSAFRATAQATGELPSVAGPAHVRRVRVWFRDEFVGRSMGKWWRPLAGDWHQSDGVMTGVGHEEIRVLLTGHLPENLRIGLDLKPQPIPGLETAHVFLSLLDKTTHWRSYCAFRLAAHPDGVGDTRGPTLVRQVRPDARLKPGQWQAVSLELNDDTLVLALDGEELFRIRDPFPPPYASRCRFCVGAWHSHVALRRLAIHDLGFRPLVPAVRPGDLLFNSGLTEQAREFYMRRLELGPAPGDLMQLRCKIGLCYLREQAYSQAQGWFDKVVGEPDDLWAQQATISNMEIAWRRDRLADFMAEARRLFAMPLLRDAVRGVLERARLHYRASGFREQMLRLESLLFELEGARNAQGQAVRGLMADSLQYMGRYAEAQKHLEQLARTRKPRAPASLLRDLAFVYAIQGKFAQSRRALTKLAGRTTDPVLLARCELVEAVNLRGERRFEDAIELLKTIDQRRGLGGSGVAHFALCQAALILCGLGRTAEARATLREQQDLPGAAPARRRNRGWRFEYVPALVDGDYEKAAAICREGCREQAGLLTRPASDCVVTGILLRLAGKREEADALWAQTARRYPVSRCAFFGALADRFRTGKRDQLEQMPCSAYERGEMFFLAALMLEAQGDARRAMQLFRRCRKEDPTLRWPACLADGKMA